MTEIELLKKKLARETAARKEAEMILEFKANELHQANEMLKKLNASLESTVRNRTAQLAESHEKFHSLLSSVGDIIYDINPSGEFIYINPAAERILGYKPAELVGKHFSILVSKDWHKKVTNFYVNQLENKQQTSYLQFEALRKNGSKVWLGQQVEMQFNEHRPPKISVVARDVQQLVDAKNAITNSEEKYRGMIEGMELGLLEVGNDGKIIKAYNQFCKMIGYTPQELVGKDPIKLFAKKDHISLILSEDQNREEGKTGVYEVELRKKNGEYIWVVISGTPFYDANGNKMGTMGIHLDITEHKKLQHQLRLAKEEAERAQQAEKGFLAKMSHELRTPLNAIIGMANLLVDEDLPAKHREYAEDIQYAGNLLLGLITDVLDISKIEAGELSIEPSEINLEQLLAMLIRTLEHKAMDKNTKLSYHIDSEVPPQLLVDRNILNQILLNLIGNAIKFTQKGSIEMKVTLAKKLGKEVIIQFEVSDNGIGIETDKLPFIFNRYKQESIATRREFGGTGLGLAICKELVELHGGKISVSSVKGKGSQFIFTLKAEVGREKKLFLNLNKNFAQNNLKNQAKILVAEDNHMNRKYLSNLLNRWKLDYTMVNDGKAAKEQAHKYPFDLILMDMEMPILDGYASTQAIRTKGKNILTPIIALTASASLEDKRKALDIGFNYYITKPFTPDQLLTLIQTVLNNEFESHTEEDYNVFLGLDMKGEVNVDKLKEFFDNDLNHASFILGIYLSQLEQELLYLSTLLENTNSNSLKKWIHKMKPGINMTGLCKLNKALEVLDEAVKMELNCIQLQLPLKQLIHELEGSQSMASQLQNEIEKRIAK